MAKRFTDTEKWKKPFVRGLQGPYKLLWLYILDDCDLAGIWQVDFDVAKIRIGENVTEADAIKFFGDRIKIFDAGRKWFIKDFNSFQYGELRSTNRMHAAVLLQLKKNNLDFTDGASEPLPRGQGQGQGQGNGQGKGQGQGQEDDSDFKDYEDWTKSILSGNDWLFNDKLRNLNIPVGDRIEEFATSHLALLAKYPKMKPPDQNRFRISLIGHIQERLNDKPNKKQSASKVMKFEDL